MPLNNQTKTKQPCLLKVIICYLKSYNCDQMNGYYWIEIITWNSIIICIR